MIAALIDSAVIVESLASSEKPDALRELLQACVEQGVFQKRQLGAVSELVAEREAIGSTGIGNGVAVPHVKTSHVASIRLALGRSIDGIDYEAIDGRPVETLFMILAPEDAAQDHLAALRWVSMLARNADFRRFVSSAETAEDIRELLREMSPDA